MSEFNPIGDASRTLVATLRDGMGTLELREDQIALVSPDEYDADGAGLSLYLYHVAQNPHLSNANPPQVDGESETGVPIVLDLHYLLTAHPPEADTLRTSDTMEQHRMLSEAVRALRENAIISGPDLAGDFSDGDRLHVSMDRQSPENLLDLWSGFQEVSHLPSISYVVTPVPIDIEGDVPAERVVEARFEHYSPSGRGQSGTDQ